MIVSVLACAALAIFCFASGQPLSGTLSLVGMVPGLGFIPLIATTIMLAINGHVVAAFFPVLIIVFNLWLAFAPKR